MPVVDSMILWFIWIYTIIIQLLHLNECIVVYNHHHYHRVMCWCCIIIIRWFSVIKWSHFRNAAFRWLQTITDNDIFNLFLRMLDKFLTGCKFSLETQTTYTVMGKELITLMMNQINQLIHSIICLKFKRKNKDSIWVALNWSIVFLDLFVLKSWFYADPVCCQLMLIYGW